LIEIKGDIIQSLLFEIKGDVIQSLLIEINHTFLCNQIQTNTEFIWCNTKLICLFFLFPTLFRAKKKSLNKNLKKTLSTACITHLTCSGNEKKICNSFSDDDSHFGMQISIEITSLLEVYPSTICG